VRRLAAGHILFGTGIPVHRGLTPRVISVPVAMKLAEFTPRADPTARELEVLQHVANGLGNKEIAKAIGRCTETVKAHLESVFRKLDAKDRAHAVTIAFQRGFIHLEKDN